MTITKPTWFCEAAISHMHDTALLQEPAEQAVPAAAVAPRAAWPQEGDGSDPSPCPRRRGLSAGGRRAAWCASRRTKALTPSQPAAMRCLFSAAFPSLSAPHVFLIKILYSNLQLALPLLLTSGFCIPGLLSQ